MRLPGGGGAAGPLGCRVGGVRCRCGAVCGEGPVVETAVGVEKCGARAAGAKGYSSSCKISSQ